MIISNYPRSGSSWFARLLSDSIDGYLINDDNISLSNNKKIKEVGKDTEIIIKGHFESYIETEESSFNIDGKLIYLYRDPRDVMVLYYYLNYRIRERNFWKIKTIFTESVDTIFNRKKGRLNRFKDQEFGDVFADFFKKHLPEWRSYMDNWYSQEVLVMRN